MGLAYLAFSEHKPALYSILFSARRPMVDKQDRDGHRDQALDGLVALLEARARHCRATRRQLAMLVWSSLHGYAMLRAVRPHMPWPTRTTSSAPPGGLRAPG